MASSCTSTNVHSFVKTLNDISTYLKLYLTIRTRIISSFSLGIDCYRTDFSYKPTETVKPLSLVGQLTLSFLHVIRQLIVRWLNQLMSFKWSYGLSFFFISTIYTYRAEFLCKMRHVVDPLSPSCWKRNGHFSLCEPENSLDFLKTFFSKRFILWNNSIVWSFTESFLMNFIYHTP